MQSIKIVNKPKYLAYQSKIAYANLPIILCLAVSNLFTFPMLVELTILGVIIIYAVFAIYWMVKARQAMKFKMSIEGDNILIQNRNGIVVKEGKVLRLENIENSFELDWIENYKRMWQLIRGKGSVPSIQYKAGEQIETVYFLVDSFFHFNQFKKLESQLQSIEN